MKLFRYLDNDGLYFLIALIWTAFKKQEKTIENLQTKLENIETHAILDSSYEP